MRVRVLLLHLLLHLLTSLTGVNPLTSDDLYVRAGELMVLRCPQYDHSGNSDEGGKLSWTHQTGEQVNVNLTEERLRQVEVLLHGRSLVILRAAEKHQGNYSCSFGNDGCQSWFRLTVYPAESTEYEEKSQYPITCFTEDSCKLTCPDVNIPPAHTPSMTPRDIVWHKDGEPSPVSSFFSGVDNKDSGVYTCTRSFLYHGQTYKKTFRVALEVKRSKKFRESRITEPQDHQVFAVRLDSPAVIDCKAVLHSEFDEIFWLSDESFVDQNNSLRVYYNYSEVPDAEETRVTASLVFTKVLQEDLLKSYTCKLESDHQISTFVTITLDPNDAPSSLRPALIIIIVVVIILLLILLTTFLSVKFKVDVALFLRDTLGCCRSTTDVKLYDACWTCYKSGTDAALNEDDSKWLVNVLEEQFGYSICLCNHLEPEKVLDDLAQSRAVVLVPTSSGPELGADLLNYVREVLVERRTRCVFVNTAAADVLRESSSAEAAHCITWRGPTSRRPSSEFCKQLRYLLPAPQHAPRKRKAYRNVVEANC